MNREIKFRGCSVDTGKWVYGGIEFQEKLDKVFIAVDEGGIHMVEVDPKSVGQHTGLHDRHGVGVYEGDVYKYFPYPDSPYSYRRVVEWAETRRYTGFNISRGDYGHQLERVEVTGNIYETLEPLEAKS